MFRSDTTIIAWQYDLLAFIFSFLLRLFYRDLAAWGLNYIPQNEVVIFLAGPHSNDYGDSGLLMSSILSRFQRRVAFIASVGVMRRPIMGIVARAMGAIPVSRAWDEAKEGSGTISLLDMNQSHVIIGQDTRFDVEIHAGDKITVVVGRRYRLGGQVSKICGPDMLILAKPLLDGPQGYSEKHTLNKLSGLKFSVISRDHKTQPLTNIIHALRVNRGICIFPEGTNHDQPGILPLRTGFAVIALKYLVENPEQRVRILPCGIHHHQSHIFRSGLGVEFGQPIEVPQSLVELYRAGYEIQAAAQLKDLVQPALQMLALPRFDAGFFNTIQTLRSLYWYSDDDFFPLRSHLSKRMWHLYLNSTADSSFQFILNRVGEYRQKISTLGLKQHHVSDRIMNQRNIFQLVLRCGQLALAVILIVPGYLILGPIIYISGKSAKSNAERGVANSPFKIKGHDTYFIKKISTALKTIPILCIVYAIGGATWFRWTQPADTWPRFLTVLVWFTLCPAICVLLSFLAWDFVTDTLNTVRALFILVTLQTTEVENIYRQKMRLEADVRRYIFNTKL